MWQMMGRRNRRASKSSFFRMQSPEKYIPDQPVLPGQLEEEDNFVAVLGGGTLWHLQKFLQYIKYIIFECTSSTILLQFSPNYPMTKYHKLNGFKQQKFIVS
jgi:hypothetical protein